MDTKTEQAEPLSLVDRIRGALSQQIQSGRYQPGDRLPSEAKLTEEFSVSRTVIREAIAILRSEGVVDARKGAGIFARDPEEAEAGRPFADIKPQRISDVIELLEMRSAVEIRAAGLAASRRSPSQLEVIVEAHLAIIDKSGAGQSTSEKDYLFHYAIAEATQNSRFPEFLTLIRAGIAPRAELTSDRSTAATAPNPDLIDEHAAIVEAISDGDAEGAEEAMRKHLNGTLLRYRAILRESLRR